jgi:glycosyltransferase involved in cell wall biosynthesis
LKRIAFVCEDISLPLDEGFKNASAHIAGSLSDLGHKVTVYTHEPANAAIPASPLPRNKLLRDRAFARELRAAGHDLLIYVPEAAATPMSMVRSSSLRSQAGRAPVVMISLQRRDYSGSGRLLLRMTGPDLVLVLSRESVSAVGSAGRAVRRIPLGVDTGVFSPAEPSRRESLRREYGVGNEKLILHVGHLRPGRNLSLLEKLAASGAGLGLVTSSSTAADPGVREMLRRSSIHVLNDHVENIADAYRVADGYAFPTVSATDAIEIPLSVLEAMATNLPVVSMAFGGLPDLLCSGGGLFLCETEEEFVASAGKMLELKDVETRKQVLTLSWEHVAESIMEEIEAGLR